VALIVFVRVPFPAGISSTVFVAILFVPVFVLVLVLFVADCGAASACVAHRVAPLP
jgi:hypothetical protein